ncbi:hypothetical protein AB835_14825 [Candidatus Endobugula sertula]|uniref:Threonyl/alanyl tRNA synthetase SAD domain-containing protein n=1 Tax=Candidatus Endobugula sertula TaxID=62101 RepID=A0A1D2QL72_9GAMM|nr:hypothetical protein AB835_14825 [Candidatus Endobugula sertula]
MMTRKTEKLYYDVGCHIREGQARFDFNMERKFSPEDVQSIEEVCNKLIDENNEILLYGSEVHPDARFWGCKGEVIPCGGTHLSHTGSVGCMQVKRKGLGKARERIICMLNNAVYATNHYKKED